MLWLCQIYIPYMEKWQKHPQIQHVFFSFTNLFILTFNTAIWKSMRVILPLLWWFGGKSWHYESELGHHRSNQKSPKVGPSRYSVINIKRMCVLHSQTKKDCSRRGFGSLGLSHRKQILGASETYFVHLMIYCTNNCHYILIISDNQRMRGNFVSLTTFQQNKNLLGYTVSETGLCWYNEHS